MKTFYIDYLILLLHLVKTLMLNNNIDSYHYKLPDFSRNDFKVLLFTVISFDYGKQFLSFLNHFSLFLFL